MMILIISAFLCIEQLIYGAFIAETGSLLQQIYFYSSGLMAVFLGISTFFYCRKPAVHRAGHTAFELSLTAVGLAVALYRTLIFEGEVFRIPTIFIAVLYGAAVVFLIPYRYSILLYTSFTVLSVLLIPRFHPEISSSTYSADIIANGIIAWFVSVMNYRTSVRGFLDKHQITRQNEALAGKNRQIAQVNRELEELSIRDSLTGLYNRRKLDVMLHELAREDRQFSILLLDLDYFKDLNDTYGHSAGDLVLKDISSLLLTHIREQDICGRWGGEEFLIICPDTDLPAACGLAKTLRKVIAGTVFENTYTLTGSFGAASTADYPQVEQLIIAADKQLYAAKHNGRNRTEPAAAGVCKP